MQVIGIPAIEPFSWPHEHSTVTFGFPLVAVRANVLLPIERAWTCPIAHVIGDVRVEFANAFADAVICFIIVKLLSLSAAHLESQKMFIFVFLPSVVATCLLLQMIGTSNPGCFGPGLAYGFPRNWLLRESDGVAIGPIWTMTSVVYFNPVAAFINIVVFAVVGIAVWKYRQVIMQVAWPFGKSFSVTRWGLMIALLSTVMTAVMACRNFRKECRQIASRLEKLGIVFQYDSASPLLLSRLFRLLEGSDKDIPIAMFVDERSLTSNAPVVAQLPGTLRFVVCDGTNAVAVVGAAKRSNPKGVRHLLIREAVLSRRDIEKVTEALPMLDSIRFYKCRLSEDAAREVLKRCRCTIVFVDASTDWLDVGLHFTNLSKSVQLAQ